MFGLGFGEILVILVIALLVFGPEKLPEIARTLGKTAAELRRGMDDLRQEFNMQRTDFQSDLQSNKTPQPTLPQKNELTETSTATTQTNQADTTQTNLSSPQDQNSQIQTKEEGISQEVSSANKSTEGVS